MKSMRAFVSHAQEDLVWAQTIKKALSDIAVETFVAHEDIRVTEEWRTRIKEELKEAEIFVAVLSRIFKRSEWCGQEVGFAVAHWGPKLCVITLATDEQKAFGFLSEYQTRSVRGADDVIATVEEALYIQRPQTIIPHQIAQLRVAQSLSTAAGLLKPLVRHSRHMDQQAIDGLVDALIVNRFVWDSEICRTDHIPELLEVLRGAIGEARYSDLRSKVRSQESPAVWL